jgi:hypothetical protein
MRERSALARGGVFSYEEVIVRAIFPFSYLKFTKRGVAAAGGGMVYKTGLK